MKQYFKYQFKKQLLPLALLVMFTFMLYVLPLLVKNYSTWNNSLDMVYLQLYTGDIFVALGLMCIFMPVYMFGYKMNKRSVDMYYSIPLSKTQVFTVHFIVGFAYVMAAFTAGYWLGFLVIAVKVKRLYLIYYLWMYLASIIPAYIIYAISVFAYTRANSHTDGVLFIGLISFAPVLIMVTLNRIGLNADSADFFFESPLYVAVDRLYNAIIKGPGGVRCWTFAFNSELAANKAAIALSELAGCIFALLAASAATVWMFLTEKRCKAENCGQISESVFGYKTMIPLYSVCLIISLTGGVWESFIMWLLLAFVAFIATIIYRRTIKIGKRQAIIMCIYIAAAIVVGLAIDWITNLQYPTLPEYAYLTYLL